MRIKRKCCLCGAEYWTGNGKAKYCSDACRKEATRLRQEKWRADHPDYHKKYYAEHPEARIRFNEHHPNYERDRWRKIRAAQRGAQECTKVCIVCGKTFATTNSRKQTCSDECQRKHRNAHHGKSMRKREYSPEKYHRQWVRRTYGSEENYQKHLEEEAEKKRQRQLQKEAEKESRRIHGTCVVCGNEFVTLNPTQKTCCQKCGKTLQYARKQHRIPKIQIVDKDITLEALYRRDSGVCYLCGGLCDWDDKDGFVVGNNYPSIDHIVPVSRGGLHAWDNVRLAHFGCNARKSNNLIPEAETLIPLNAYSVKREPTDPRKRTIQLSKDGTVIAEYESTAEAERVTGIKQRGIQNCARGDMKTYCGFAWRYA